MPFNIDIEEIKWDIEFKKERAKLYRDYLEHIHKISPRDKNLIKEVKESLEKEEEELEKRKCELFAYRNNTH